MAWLDSGQRQREYLHASLKILCLIDATDKLQCKALFPDIFDWRAHVGHKLVQGLEQGFQF